MSELPFPLWSQEENTIPYPALMDYRKGLQLNTHTLPPNTPAAEKHAMLGSRVSIAPLRWSSAAVEGPRTYKYGEGRGRGDSRDNLERGWW